MPRLVLGPLLRYVSDTEATVWAETDAPCEVAVLGRTASSFTIAGHHYALVVLDGLAPASTLPYEVSLDGVACWPPPGDPYPPCVIRTHTEDESLRLAFGSCRVSVPHVKPYVLRKDEDPRGREVDALLALVERMRHEPCSEWPDAFLLLGDQVYADEVSPKTKELIASRRGAGGPPPDEVGDFEEYTSLYRESWSDPALRWLLSTVSSAMIFDDHDVHDDWNISAAWIAKMRAKPWWEERILGAYMSYWVYQHLGNLTPGELREDDLLRRVKDADDGGPALREFAYRADRDPDCARWSYHRDLGEGTRLLMVDSRAARVLERGPRDMLDEREWTWLEENAVGGFEHLLIGSSLPIFMTPGTHWVEASVEAICAGRLGPRAARVAERDPDRYRRMADAGRRRMRALTSREASAAALAEAMGLRQFEKGTPSAPLLRAGSFVLGSNEVSPLSMAAAYAAFAAHGLYCPPRPVTEILDSAGRPIEVKTPSCSQVLEPAIADTVTEVLTGVIDGSTR
ncbi:MAG: alkaline phosphatase D family protein, partial [Actinobacteria bacterium]|nr:alkaline phosphatase D family protein [Actinomycetota bacterium]